MAAGSDATPALAAPVRDENSRFALIVGPVLDLGVAVIPSPDAVAVQLTYVVAAILATAVATGLYVGAGWGPGPRDGLMTGLARRTGRSIRLVRTSLEVTVVLLGWLLGGVVGIGTLAYALLIGPVVQLFLPILTVRVRRPVDESRAVAPAPSPGELGFPA